MKNLKLTELILSFTPSELRRFGDFIRSPFYNKSKKLILIYEYFENTIASSSEILSKEDLWNYINPEEKFSDSKLRSYLSDFKKLLEKFITTVEQEKYVLHQKNILLNFLSVRNLKKNYDVISKEISSELDRDYTKNFDHYFNEISFKRTLILNEGRNVEDNLDELYYRLSDSIDRYFFSSKLDLVNSLLSRKYHVLGGVKLDINFTGEIISFIEKNLKEVRKNSPFIYCEYLIFKMMTADNNVEYFAVLQAHVLKNIKQYNQQSLEQVYFPMINFGFNKVAMGENEYLDKLFYIYKSFELKGFYRNMEVFQDIDFISIVIAGLRLKKFSWVESFVERYKSKLANEFKEDTVNLIRALISFTRKEYRTAIDFLNEVNYQNSYYYLKSKETLMQIYFEQKEYEALESLIDSTRHYLNRRRDVLSIHYDRYMMFLKYLGMLLRSIYDDKSNLIILKKELKNNINVIAREWLAEKVEEYLKRETSIVNRQS